VDRIRGFSDAMAIDEYLTANPETTPGAVIFQEEMLGDQLSRMDFTLQFNSTPKFFKGNFQDPNMFFQMPMQMAVEREIHRYFRQLNGLSTDNLAWSFEIKPFPHPALATVSSIATFASAFIFAAAMFNFVFVVIGLVGEREAGLRNALRTVGMLDSSYWLSWGTWHLALSFVYALVICVSGYILQLDLFLKNNFGVVFMLLFMFSLSMTTFAYIVSAFVKKSASATVLGFALFVIGWVMQSVVLFFPYSPEEKDRHGGFWYAFFAIFPWNLLGKSLSDLGGASATEQSPGIAWSERYSYCVNWESDDRPPATPNVYKDYSCVISIGEILEIWAVEVFVYFVFAIYLDNILKNENGLRRPPWYFFMPAYWVAPKQGRSSIQVGAKRSGCFGGPPPLQEPAEMDSDVQEEQQTMKKLFQDRTGADPDAWHNHGRAGISSNPQRDGAPLALEVYGLRKWFGGFQAIKNSWFSVEEGQLFCLLGPNGAGKSTTINCLTGILPPDGGDALIYDESLTASGGMDRIRSFIGVCPQFDVLWGELTGQEHLEIYGQVKGLPPKQVKREARELLHNVKLLDSASIRAGSYSGGMKRRLSVAVALLGNPKVVYLDEPTTGMDPITRRHVWDIVEAAKKNRAIILTTHSMEEADILGDRIAIMARGSLRCIGSSLRLKNKFGAGYCISVNVLPSSNKSAASLHVASRAAKVKDFFKAKLGLEPSDETKAYVQFLIPKEKEDEMPGFLAELKDAGDELGVTDLHVALTSLEEVFLSIARQAEIENDGSGSRQVELDDGTLLQVPLGLTVCAHPTTGAEYTIKWGQDETGNLQVLYAQPTAAADGASSS